MPLRRTAALLATLLLTAVAPMALATTVPAWVQAQIGAAVPEHNATTAAVLLYSETALTVLPNGKIRQLQRKVIKILRQDGVLYGIIRADSSAEARISSMHGWNVPADGKPTEVDDGQAVESAVIGVDQSNLAADARSKLLRIPGVIPGNIVASEVEQEFQPYQLADDWVFQDTIPIREAHYSLELPGGWSYKARWINHPEVAPTISGSRTLWTVTDLKALREEAQMPPLQALSGRLALSLIPAGGHGQSLETWGDMGRWYTSLTVGRWAVSPEMKHQVAALTDAQPSLLGKIQAVAAFVQSDVRYVAVELGIGKFQPHPAAEVFMHRYGDCKDKVTLLGAMLKELGVDSSYVLVNTKRGAVSESTAPNMGFDHVIIAIRLPAAIQDPRLLAVVTHPKLGRILLFDPTQTYAPLGLLEGPLQGGVGLLVTDDGGELMRLPVLPVTASTMQRTAHLTLDPAGTLRGDVEELSAGDVAAIARSEADATAQGTNRSRPIEAVLTGSFTAFKLTNPVIHDLGAHDRPLEWNYSIEVPNYAEASGDILTLRPRVLGSKSTGLLETKEPRENDIEFEGPRRDTDVFEIALPEGYVVDEMPPPLDLDYPYASYHSKTEMIGRTMRYTRSFEIRSLTVPVAQAAELKDFFRTILNEERGLAVLRRAAH